MRTVRVAQTFEASVPEAERRWYDTSHWADWVDGLDRVLEVDGDWPNVGASVTWESGPAGRGQVTERVVDRHPLTGQTLEVQDDSIRGRQSVAFTATAAGVEIALSLEYELKRRSIITPIVDALFIKRAMAVSMGLTVSRFGAALHAGHR
jgi:Polyketide cyclase / dehydrase and lipid transport